jgi:ABC-type branched-subunit amino acid transport system substrate-binding protein
MAEAWVGLQPRRGILRAAGLALAIFLASCQGVVPKGHAPGPAAPAAPQGPITSALPQDEARHRIALLVPLTGPNAAVGQSIANAANLALIDTGGKKLRMTTYDTGPGAMSAAQRAVADGNRLFLGPLLAADVRAIVPVAGRAGIPIISFSNDSEVAGGNVYLLGFAPDQAVRRVVDYARSRGITKFAGLMPSGLYGRNASSVFIRSVEAANGKVVAMKDYDRNPKSVTTAAKLLGISQPYDAVLIADGGRIAVVAAPLIRKGTSPQARILGTELWNADSLVARSPALQGAWYASVADGFFNQLSNKYRTRFGKAPFRLASLGYDAVLLATRVAADWKVGTAFPVRELEDSGGFSGVDGAFRFGSSHIAERALEVHEVGAGGGSIVSPAPRGFGN